MTNLEVVIALNSHPKNSPFWDSNSGQEILRIADFEGFHRTVSNRYASIVEREAMGATDDDGDEHDDTSCIQSADIYGTGEGQFHGLIS